MYNASFVATDSADWAEAIEFYAAGPTADEDLIPPDASFELAVRDRHGSRVLHASTAEGTIIRPSLTVISWRFTPEQTRSLCDGRSYSVGLTMTTNTGTEQILTGTLSFIDGIVK